MKRFAIFVLTLLGVALLAMWGNEILNRSLILSSAGSTAYKMHRLFVAPPADEIPILGSSRANANFVPSFISPKAFNYGVDGSPQYETLFHLKRILRNQASGPIIVNLDPWGFGSYEKPVFRADYRLALSDPEVRAALPASMTAPEERIPGIRFHGALRETLSSWMNERRIVTKKIVNGAVLQLLSRTSAEWQVINAKLGATDFHSDPRWQSELNAIYASTARPIVWVVGPTSPRWRELFRGETALRAFLDEQRKHPNVHVIDLYTPTADWDESEFMDPTHLNIHGAERFTRLLRAELDRFSIPGL